jgi:lipopolysaccharide export system protein LptC
VLTHDPDYAVEKFVMTRLGETGEARYKIAGDRLLHYPDDETSHLKNPVLTRLDVEAPPMRVNADRGLITADGSDVYLNGNVVLFRPADPARPAYRDFLRISSSYMHVLPDADRATSPKPVLIENGASTLRGTGMDFDARYRTLNVKSTVTAQYVQRPAPQKKTQR